MRGLFSSARLWVLCVLGSIIAVGSFTAPSRTSMITRISMTPLHGLQENLQRSQYFSAMAARIAYFIFERNLVYPKQPSQRTTKLDYAALAQTILRVALNDTRREPARIFIGLNATASVAASERIQDIFADMFHLLRMEYEHIKSGTYKYPYDLVPWNGDAIRQWSPVSVIRTSLENRKVQKVAQALMNSPTGSLQVRDNFLVGTQKYPEYYLQNFHFQPDGWLSETSANLYDYQVEGVFMGMADVMRRQALPYVMDYLKDKDMKHVRLLDLATGTGRFVSFVKENAADLHCTVLDLSPFYLRFARTQTLQKWEDIVYAEAAAENIPLPENGPDICTCIYTFHELPLDIRERVMGEAFRVLKPGGVFIVVDSIQEGDTKYDDILTNFRRTYHEPYYDSYIKMDMLDLYARAGFERCTSKRAWVSKVFVGFKP